MVNHILRNIEGVKCLRILLSSGRPWGVLDHLRYDYENFPHSLDDPKRVCIVIETRTNFDKKNFFIEISDSKFKFFSGIWKSLKLFLLACNWLKYEYGTFSQSLGDAKHVRIGLKKIKKIVEKNVFIGISDSNLTFPMEPLQEKFPSCQLWVSKNILWDLKSKIRFHSFVGLDLQYRLSTHNMVIPLELKATKNQKWKN